MTADDKARLDALTPDVLRAHAACALKEANEARRIGVIYLDIGATEDARVLLEQKAQRFYDLAALCEAVAGAQEEMVSRSGHVEIAASVNRQGMLFCNDDDKPLAYRITLAAALGAVSEAHDA